MHRLFSIASFTAITSLCLLGCHGSPPAESTPSADDTKAKASAAGSEAAAPGSDEKASKDSADSTAKSEGDSENRRLRARRRRTARRVAAGTNASQVRPAKKTVRAARAT